MEQVKEKDSVLSWSVFLGCMFLGGGIGMFFDQTGVGTLIGLGVGYIASAIVESVEKKNRSQSNITG
jgi:hypothetical protein